jgi:hypothetical protein
MTNDEKIKQFENIFAKLASIELDAYTLYLNSSEDREHLPLNPYTGPKSSKELEDAGWTKFCIRKTTKFYHPALDVTNNRDATLFYKAALFDKFDPDNKIGKKWTDLVYVSDKWSEKRGMENTVFEPISQLEVHFEYFSTQGVYRIRHNGSKVGFDLFSLYNYEAKLINLANNKEYLKLMQHGPDHNDKSLICHLSGQSMSLIELTNFETGLKSAQSSHQLHHARYDKTGSIYKIVEPSQLLGMKNFKNFTQEEHMELLGCIILSGDSHDAIHNSNKQDGIDNWFKRLELKECYSLPYHWVSIKNYNNTLAYLSENTEYFDRDLALSYDAFMKKHSVSTAITKSTLVELTESSIDEPATDCALLPKNHPSLQIPSLYNSVIGQQQTLDFEDKQPTYLYD